MAIPSCSAQQGRHQHGANHRGVLGIPVLSQPGKAKIRFLHLLGNATQKVRGGGEKSGFPASVRTGVSTPRATRGTGVPVPFIHLPVPISREFQESIFDMRHCHNAAIKHLKIKNKKTWAGRFLSRKTDQGKKGRGADAEKCLSHSTAGPCGWFSPLETGAVSDGKSPQPPIGLSSTDNAQPPIPLPWDQSRFVLGLNVAAASTAQPQKGAGWGEGKDLNVPGINQQKYPSSLGPVPDPGQDLVFQSC